MIDKKLVEEYTNYLEEHGCKYGIESNFLEWIVAADSTSYEEMYVGFYLHEGYIEIDETMGSVDDYVFTPKNREYNEIKQIYDKIVEIDTLREKHSKVISSKLIDLENKHNVTPVPDFYR